MFLSPRPITFKAPILLANNKDDNAALAPFKFLVFTILLKCVVYRRDIATLIRLHGNGGLNIGLEWALIIIKRSVTTTVERGMASINVDMSGNGTSYW